MRRFLNFTLLLVVALVGWIGFTQFVCQPSPDSNRGPLSLTNTAVHGASADDSVITIPQLPDSLKSEDTLLVAYKHLYRMELYYSGKLIKTYIIGLGQEPIGHKQQQGDNRTPEGDYRIIEKAIGPFPETNLYLGTRWMRINYPNSADAKAGLEKKLITQEQCNQIISANKAGTQPLKTTKLGGGIGIHGWYGRWPGDDKQDLTWGCITMQNDQVEDLYPRVGVQTRILIFP
jgi:hypothetical protein